jgi:spore germination protein
VKDNIENIKQLMNSPSNLITRVFTIANTNISCAVVCIDGLADKAVVEKNIMENIQLDMPRGRRMKPILGARVGFEIEHTIFHRQQNSFN